MLMMTPVIIWSAYSLAIFGSVFVNLLTRTMKQTEDFYGTNLQKESDDSKNSYALYTMTLLGLGEILGG